MEVFKGREVMDKRKEKSKRKDKAKRTKTVLEKTEKLQKKKAFKEALASYKEDETEVPADFHCSACVYNPQIYYFYWRCGDEEKHKREWSKKFKLTAKSEVITTMKKKERTRSKQTKGVCIRKFKDNFEDVSQDEEIIELDRIEDDAKQDDKTETLTLIFNLDELILDSSKVKNEIAKKYVEKPKIRTFKDSLVVDTDNKFLPKKSKLLTIPPEVELPPSLQNTRSHSFIILHLDDLMEHTPVGWRKKKGQTVPVRFFLEHVEKGIAILISVVSKYSEVVLCSLRVVVGDTFVPRSSATDKISTLDAICLQALEDQSAEIAATNYAKKYRDVISLLGGENGDNEKTDLYHLLKMNEDKKTAYTCGICLEDVDDATSLNSCGHFFCSACWTLHLRHQSQQAVILCPEHGCESTVDLVTIAWFTRGRQDSWKRYLDVQIERDPTLLTCYSCNRLVRRGMEHCGCGKPLCVKCGVRAHWPAACKDMQLFTRFQNETLGMDKVEVFVRTCPKCRQKWEKSYGCNHLICNKCGANFCWGCGNTHKNGVYCGSDDKPLEKITFRFMGGISEERNKALEMARNLTMTSGLKSEAQARGIAVNIIFAFDRDIYFQYTRRRKRGLEQLDLFKRMEESIRKALATWNKGQACLGNAYIMEESAGQARGQFLRKMGISLKRLIALAGGRGSGGDLGSWLGQLEAVTEQVETQLRILQTEAEKCVEGELFKFGSKAVWKA